MSSTFQSDLGNYDALVIGAGPAGSAAAYTLASRGVRVCLVDKAVFPRDKLCGGLVTHRSINLLSEIFENKLNPDLFTKSHDVIFKMASKTLSSTRSTWPLYFTMR